MEYLIAEVVKTTQYLKFIVMSKTDKTVVLSVTSVRTGSMLGVIKWYGQWRQYTFHPEDNTIFNPQCLADINSVINEMMDEREKRKNEKKRAVTDAH